MLMSLVLPAGQSFSRSRSLNTALLFLLALLLMCVPELSSAQGLNKTVTTMEKIREWAWLIIPIVCLLAGGIVGVLYSLDIVRKDTLYTWTTGIIFAGLVAGGLVELVF